MVIDGRRVLVGYWIRHNVSAYFRTKEMHVERDLFRTGVSSSCMNVRKLLSSNRLFSNHSYIELSGNFDSS